ncbi:MAG TPA: glycosyltransferase [Prevotella sp.]|nr:glycosyltransferase [Prevotella sp.]
MRILLIGEYSNVHWTLAQGLRTLGHEVTVLSNGDFWKDYPRDINLRRVPTHFGGIRYLLRLYSLLPHLKGYDVVQIINPMFLEVKAERIWAIYHYLRRHNGNVFLGAYGMDSYWVKSCIEAKPLRYSDFNIGSTLRTNADALKDRKEWIGTEKEKLNQFIAEDCDGIIAGLYEYYVSYHPCFPHKTTFIPYPIKLPSTDPVIKDHYDSCNVFIGINKSRNEYKGTDIMLKAAQDVQERFPQKMTLTIAESVPFQEYQHLMEGSDVILDQLYSYTPAMNSLLAMSKGIIVIGGGEPENYEILHESELRPIINVQPTYQSVYHALEELVLNLDRIPLLKRQSVEYIRRHHEYTKVARQYEAFYINRKS